MPPFNPPQIRYARRWPSSERHGSYETFGSCPFIQRGSSPARLCDAGIRQFIDIGSGLPSSPNVHEIAQAGDTGARVVYVDNDPVVSVHAEALMAKNHTTAVVRADLRDVDVVLSRTAELLDFARPVGLLFVGCLHHIADPDDPAGVVARYLAALAPGSYLVISHATDERSPEKMRANAEVAKSSGAVLIPRSKDAILRMFNGRELVDPGLVLGLLLAAGRR